MRQTDATINEKRNNVTCANNLHINTPNNQNNTTNIIYDVVKFLWMIDKYPGLRIEHCNFNVCFVGCHWNRHEVCVNQSSNIKIDETEPILCNKTCMTAFSDTTLDITVESKKRELDENGRWLKT